MMKKTLIFILLLCTLLITSCAKQFKCQIDYQVVYSDTTYVRSYVFDGNERASYEILDNGKHFNNLPSRNVRKYSRKSSKYVRQYYSV